jgi:FtsP/CotA-like multicopper oxidase with cupredoxin domain
MNCQSRLAALVLGLMLIPVATVSFAADTKTDDAGSPVQPVANPCPRFAPGSVVHNPAALFSSGGVLNVRFSFQQRFDSNGHELLCFMTPDGFENPTLHVKPGDHLIITVTNNTPAQANMPPLLTFPPYPICGNPQPTHSSINIHYHGTNTSPQCFQDNVIRTVINSGDTFRYDVTIPLDAPPGLFWYHPHIHMLAEPQTQSGATGAIIVEGIEGQQPAVIGLKQRVFVVRDQLVPPGNPSPCPPQGTVAPCDDSNNPTFDLTLNFIPISSPPNQTSNTFVPAIVRMKAGTKEFWRVSNSTADTILDLQYVFDGAPQTMQLVAVDGVTLNSQDSTGPGSVIQVKHFTLPEASRVEFIVSAPPSSARLAQLITQRVITHSIYNIPPRPLATVQLSAENDQGNNEDNAGNSVATSTTGKRFRGLASAPIAVKRTVFFDENVNVTPPQFFMAVEGKPEHLFNPNAPPDIVATQGTVEEWTVENRTLETHEFHIHQIHFLVESQNNFQSNGSQPIAAINGQYLDTVQVPFWILGQPFPSVTLRMDFRGSDIGVFVFHCHILSHEDLGMMNLIQVIPRDQSAAANPPKGVIAEQRPRSGVERGAAQSADALGSSAAGVKK